MKKEEESFLRKVKPIIFWDGFPVCALLIKKVADKFKENLIIVATKSRFPFAEPESILEHDIIWLNNANDIWKYKNKFNDRNFIIHSGWIYKGWLKYDKLMKQRNKAMVVVAVDNRFRGDFRQLLGALWFRLCLKKYFDAAIVPGKSGQKLMRFLGMDPDKIYTGLYGAYEGIFKETVLIEKRAKEFLFVGQLNKRKSVDVLLDAFKNYRRAGGTWTLRMVGDGPLKNTCHGDGVISEAFAQPQDIVKKMNAAKVLVLPSRDDNWGTVICEAAACGMHIISTQSVAASADIIQNNTNGIVLENISSSDLEKAFFSYENMPKSRLKEGSGISKAIARRYNSEAFFNVFMKMANASPNTAI